MGNSEPRDQVNASPSGQFRGATPGLSAVIEQSWLRSREAGLDPDLLPEAEYIEGVDLQRRMVDCARPVLDRLEDDLSGMRMSIALTDEHARVMFRRDLDKSLSLRMDDVGFAPGFDYSESSVGTNGVGTAIEAGMAVYVDGKQHFNPAIRQFTCAGAPIRDPLTGRLEGIIDISSRASDASPLMRNLAARAARDIEVGLRETGSAKQQAVLSEFLLACRRRRAVVFSLSCGVFMSNSAAARRFDPTDESFIREEAYAMLVPSHPDKVGLILPSGLAVEVRRRIVTEGVETAGIVVEVTEARKESVPPRRTRRRAALPGVVGSSPQWSRVSAAVAECAGSGDDVLVIGEIGSGRVALARGAHMAKNPLAPIEVVQCGGSDIEGRVEEALKSAATCVVLSGIDCLDDESQSRIAELVERDQRAYPARWIVGTASDSFDTSQSTFARCFARTIHVPALRHHPDDIVDIARAHAGRIAQSRTIDIDDSAIRMLRRYQWPGNVPELIEVLAAALRSRPSGTITATDLPPSIHSAPRRSMTPMEVLERDAIVSALKESDGNRRMAAELLGISRSSLYRKLSTFSIDI